MNEKIKGNWEITNEDSQLVCIRPLNELSPHDFEFIRIAEEPDDKTHCRFIHSVIFLSDIDFNNLCHLEYLSEALKDFGYEDVDEFVAEDSPCVVDIRNEKGEIDRVNSPTYMVDYFHLASLLAENATSVKEGMLLPAEEAYVLAARITGLDFSGSGKEE